MTETIQGGWRSWRNGPSFAEVQATTAWRERWGEREARRFTANAETEQVVFTAKSQEAAGNNGSK